jgi:DNA repair protein RecN (Recombination protein N)
VLPSFEKEVVTILKSLGIKDANFKVESERSTGLTKDGIDKVRFLFNANKGLELKDLASTASGGELSRLMLSIKSMISQKNLLPTIIFDEIDNGVSGEVAGRIGTILKRMGKTMQVVAITHLPQIAGKGEHHYQVYKAVQNERSATFIRPLSVEERISEIARMLSDETISPSALATAKELLNN